MSTSTSSGPLDQPVTLHVWKEKYRHADEQSPSDTFRRVVAGVYAKDDPAHAEEALAALEARDAGRLSEVLGRHLKKAWERVSETLEGSSR